MLSPTQIQKKTLWCWAAVASSVDAFSNPTSKWDQCHVVKAVLKISPCCKKPSAATSCNQQESLSKALRTINRLNTMLDYPVEFEVVEEELVAQRPVCARIAWDTGGAHFVFIDGCWPDDQWIMVWDPMHGHSKLAYEEFKTAYRAIGQWTNSYLVR